MLGVLVGTALNLLITSGDTDIFKISNLLIQEQGMFS